MAKKKVYLKYDGTGRIIPSASTTWEEKPSGRFKELIDPNPDPACCDNNCKIAKDYTSRVLPFNGFTTGGTKVATTEAVFFSANNIPIGFGFNFYGTTYGAVSIGSNGIIQFSNTLQYNYEDALLIPSVFAQAPSLFPFVEFLAYDASVIADTGIYYQTFNDGGDVYFSVRFRALLVGAFDDFPITVEVRLHKDSNVIDYIYSDIPNTIDPSVQAALPIVGLQNYDAAEPNILNVPFVNYLDYTLSSDLSNKVVRFTPKCTEAEPLDLTCTCYTLTWQTSESITFGLHYLCGLPVYTFEIVGEESPVYSFCSYNDPRLTPRVAYGVGVIDKTNDCESCVDLTCTCYLVTKDSPNNDTTIQVGYQSCATGFQTSIITSNAQSYMCAVTDSFYVVSGDVTITPLYNITYCVDCPAQDTIKKCYTIADATYNSSGVFTLYATHSQDGATWDEVTFTGTPSSSVSLPSDFLCSYLLPYATAGSATIAEIPVQPIGGCTCTTTFFCDSCDYAYWEPIGNLYEEPGYDIWRQGPFPTQLTKLSSNRVAFYGRNESGYGATILTYEFDGTNWTKLGSYVNYYLNNYYFINYSYISDNVLITPYITYYQTPRIAVSTFDGTTWTQSNDAGIIQIPGSYPSKQLNGCVGISTTKLFLLTSDYITQSMELHVVEYTGTDWDITSSTTISPNTCGNLVKISNTSLAIMGTGDVFTNQVQPYSSWRVFNLVAGVFVEDTAASELNVAPAFLTDNLSATEVVATYCDDVANNGYGPVAYIRTYDKVPTGLDFVPIGTPIARFPTSNRSYVAALSSTEAAVMTVTANYGNMMLQKYNWVP